MNFGYKFAENRDNGRGLYRELKKGEALSRQNVVKLVNQPPPKSGHFSSYPKISLNSLAY